MTQTRVVNGTMPATEKQIQYLQRLGVEVPEGLTVQQASQMIDDAKEKVKFPLT